MPYRLPGWFHVLICFTKSQKLPVVRRLPKYGAPWSSVNGVHPSLARELKVRVPEAFQTYFLTMDNRKERERERED